MAAASLGRASGGIVVLIEIVGDGLRQHRVTDPEPCEAVSLRQRARHQQVGMDRHELRYRLAGETDECLVHQKARVRVAAQQIRQRRHIEDAAVGIVGIHNHGQRSAGRNVELFSVRNGVSV